MEVGNTLISRPMSLVVTAAFILTIISVPVVQHIVEVRAGFAESGRWVVPSVYEIFEYPRQAWKALVSSGDGDLVSRLRDANAVLMRGFKTYEEALESDSFIAQATLPRVQAFTAEFLGLGNEQVLLGRKRWLFYEPDVAYLTGPGFLDSTFLRSRARGGDSGESIQPDPLKAIVEFRDQLKSRGIHLIIMPIPVKPMIEPELLSASYGASSSLPIQNPSYRAFLESLDAAQVDYLDVSGSLAESKRLTGLSQVLAHGHALDAASHAACCRIAG